MLRCEEKPDRELLGRILCSGILCSKSLTGKRSFVATPASCIWMRNFGIHLAIVNSYVKIQSEHPKFYREVSEVSQSCPTLCDPMDCSLPGSSLHGILQARVLEWVAISFSRGSSQSRDWTLVSCIPGRHFNLWATRVVRVLQRREAEITWVLGDIVKWLTHHEDTYLQRNC